MLNGISVRQTNRYANNFNRKKGLPPIELKNEQMYVHPRSKRVPQCSCGWPKVDCRMGEDGRNYCAKIDTEF